MLLIALSFWAASVPRWPVLAGKHSKQIHRLTNYTGRTARLCFPFLRFQLLCLDNTSGSTLSLRLLRTTNRQRQTSTCTNSRYRQAAATPAVFSAEGKWRQRPFLPRKIMFSFKVRRENVMFTYVSAVKAFVRVRGEEGLSGNSYGAGQCCYWRTRMSQINQSSIFCPKIQSWDTFLGNSLIFCGTGREALASHMWPTRCQLATRSTWVLLAFVAMVNNTLKLQLATKRCKMAMTSVQNWHRIWRHVDVELKVLTFFSWACVACERQGVPGFALTPGS